MPPIEWSPQLENIFWFVLLLIIIGLFLALLLLGWVAWRVKRVYLPAGASFVDTLKVTPLAVVLLLDVLDFSLDFFSAPLSWVILGRLGLAPLRNVALIEGLVPGTQFLPTMTLAWLAVRIFLIRSR